MRTSSRLCMTAQSVWPPDTICGGGDLCKLGIMNTYYDSCMLEPVMKHRNNDLRFPLAFCIAVILFLVAVQAEALRLFGQPFLSKTHALMLWAGDVHGTENSQQLTDWYTFSHIIHGFLFYFALWAIFKKRLTFWQRLALA